ncbi:Com family DNA-binding transcriptional regulator [Pseudovibrio exalbescens]|uniref:Com family DNA-binding transcriptional regulator n=1 Tax=Pseudovibrio exalbescens TaxID=197461 RepID=UPI000C9BACE0
MESIRCQKCSALLFKTEHKALNGRIEIKCRRCGTFNDLRPDEPFRDQRKNDVKPHHSCEAGRTVHWR